MLIIIETKVFNNMLWKKTKSTVIGILSAEFSVPPITLF
jgi:hypothetical protein